MTRYIIIGLIAICIIIGLVEACVDGISNMYASITSPHEEVAEAIDRDDNILKIHFTRKGVSSRVYK